MQKRQQICYLDRNISGKQKSMKALSYRQEALIVSFVVTQIDGVKNVMIGLIFPDHTAESLI